VAFSASIGSAASDAPSLPVLSGVKDMLEKERFESGNEPPPHARTGFIE
jgi:hypothetical protein